MENENIIKSHRIESSIIDNDIPRLRRLVSKYNELDINVNFSSYDNIIIKPTRKNNVDVVRELMYLPCIKNHLDRMLDIVTSKLNKKCSLNIDKTIEILKIIKTKYEEDNNMVSFVKVFKTNGKDYKKWMK